jgi:hypothetical protein
MNDAFLAALEKESIQEIAAAIMESEFYCVNVSEDAGDKTSALVFEIDDYPALVGFTTEDHAGTFAEYFDGVQLDANGELPCFVVSGKEFLVSLPRSFGLAINPETEHAVVFEPKMTRQLKRAVTKSK